MPVYRFKCNECGHTVDQLRAIEDRKIDEECPICDDGVLKLVIAAHANTPNKWKVDR